MLAISTFGCADKKIEPLRDIGGPRESSIPYDITPEKKGELFVDKTAEYGLTGVQAVHMYAVDANHDGATDLVVLDDFMVSPKFYFFNKSEKKIQTGCKPFCRNHPRKLHEFCGSGSRRNPGRDSRKSQPEERDDSVPGPRL